MMRRGGRDENIENDSGNVGIGGKRISDYLFACLVSFVLMLFYVFLLGSALLTCR